MAAIAHPASCLSCALLWQLLVQHHLCCAALRVGDSPHDGEPDYAEQLRAAAAGNATRVAVTGPLQKIGEAIDDFLIPRLEWRFSHCSGSRRKSKCVLLRVSDTALRHFRVLDSLQFPADTEDPNRCPATIKTSSGWVGQATEEDFYFSFERWVSDVKDSKKRTAFLPVWSDPRMDSHPAEYFSPFCGELDVSSMTASTVSPMTRQECFFLPTSSCTMDTAHWGKNLVDETDMAVPFRHRLSKPFDHISSGDLHVMWQMLFFRQNARTRDEIARREAEWRSENQAWPASGAGPTCAAIHVRHGDKLTPFWIKAHDTIAGGFNKSFDDYLDVALKMMKEKPQLTDASRSKERPLVFVMSDDADIIAKAKGSRRAVVHTVSPGTPLPSLSDTLADGKNDFGYAAANSGDMLSWLLSIRLMSACSLFVGNTESSFSRFLYYGMCEQRNGICPRLFSFGRRLDESPTIFEE
ncbi:unnamed protein product [Prorocentrum cordatum]|uniref:Uncharacterized protein n=1 Tax=Prorocentrum cordatum TaxID=2364126 RepID=A0ABN9T6B5_9DINO|nr:unnamed protein product [Polarella glacialis]|mmetsp:Transcript_21292/g.60512  ORF Transcript_21292/g.60512 Transcript_21292/m.60512 type:complete len:467 (+) Transcript_21292:124-1524(+)